MNHYVYRALTKQQNADFLNGKDILAKDPYADAAMSDHVRGNKKCTQWISTTKNLYILFAQRKNMDFNAAIIRIDLDIAEQYGARVFDISTDEMQEKYGIYGKRAKNFAKGEREVLIEGFIPKEACSLIVAEGMRTMLAEEIEIPEFELLSEKYLIPELSSIDNMKALRERINTYGLKTKKTLTRSRVRRILEIVYFLNTYQPLVTKTKWASINLQEVIR